MKLRNAVEARPDLKGIGVQLGQDFFLSGRFCVVDTHLNDELMYRCDGLVSWLVGERSGKEESLRYYAHNGQSCSVPLHHFNPNKNGKVTAFTLKRETVFTECSWCNRTFPKGMHLCAGCEKVYYCDDECAQAAWKVHKVACRGSNSAKFGREDEDGDYEMID